MDSQFEGVFIYSVRTKPFFVTDNNYLLKRNKNHLYYDHPIYRYVNFNRMPCCKHISATCKPYIYILYGIYVHEITMDDFDKDFSGFDWKNTPAYKHPGGKDCPCPKHEYIREQINVAKNLNSATKNLDMNKRPSSNVTLKFCPDHYNVYFKEVIPAMPLKFRIMTKIALKLGAVVIQQIPYMMSDKCFYCKFGSGGFDKKVELPPI